MSVQSTQSASTVTLEKINNALSGLFEADKTRMLEPICSAIMECTKLGMGFQEIETKLRDKHCFTYLMAKDRDPEDDKFYIFVLNGFEKIYKIWISTFDIQCPIREMFYDQNNQVNLSGVKLLDVREIYDENYRRLTDAGWVTIKR